MFEVWRNVKDFPGYQVSNQGRVRSVDRAGADGRWLRGKVLKPGDNGWGYKQVHLSHDGKSHPLRVHRLVALEFLGQPVGDQDDVNHKNGIKDDNRVENLEWVTRAENVQHSYDVLGRNDGWPKGVKIGTPYKLTDDQVRQMRAEYTGARGEQAALARKYGISQTYTTNILNGNRRAEVG